MQLDVPDSTHMETPIPCSPEIPDKATVAFFSVPAEGQGSSGVQVLRQIEPSRTKPVGQVPAEKVIEACRKVVPVLVLVTVHAVGPVPDPEPV